MILSQKISENNYCRFEKAASRIPTPPPIRILIHRTKGFLFLETRRQIRRTLYFNTLFNISRAQFSRAQPIRHSIFAINVPRPVVEVVCACDLSRARCNVDRDVLFSHKAN